MSLNINFISLRSFHKRHTMKRILSTISFGLCFSTLLLSCSKGDYNSGSGKTGYNPFGNSSSSSGTSSGGNFTAKINGRAFSANTYYASNLGGMPQVYGSHGTSSTDIEAIQIFPTSLAAGTYTIGSTITICSYVPVGATTPVSPTSGNMVITSNDGTTVVGTFDLHASGLDITEGQFNVPIK